MTSIDVKRIDHHGLVAGVIDDLQIPEIIDETKNNEPVPICCEPWKVAHWPGLRFIAITGVSVNKQPVPICSLVLVFPARRPAREFRYDIPRILHSAH